MAHDLCASTSLAQLSYFYEKCLQVWYTGLKICQSLLKSILWSKFIGPRRGMVGLDHVLGNGIQGVAGIDLYNAILASKAAGPPNYNYWNGTKTCGVGTTDLTGSCDGDAASLYSAATNNDFAFWAAAWAYKASGDSADLLNAQTFQQAYIQVENSTGLQ